MGRSSNTELIITDNGRIYHLQLLPDEIADTIILVGDPQRVELVSSFFDSIEVKVSNREMVTHTGYYNKKPITVISTGIGPDNIDIVLNELDALVNIDMKIRQPKENTKRLNLVRLGTSGALQRDIPINSFVITTHGIGLDGLIYFYEGSEEVIDLDWTNAFLKHMNWQEKLATPYIVKGNRELFEKLSKDLIPGMTVTASGFYGPQGREVRLGLADPSVNSKLQTFGDIDNRVLNYEMETAALFGLGRLLGHRTASICLIMANRLTGEYTKFYKREMNSMIPILLDRLTE
jgi:uridine phosphorylase